MVEVRTFASGRRVRAQLTPGGDLLADLAAACRRAGLAAATLAVTGSVRSATIGTFDPDQQVYVTHRVEQPLELGACRGTADMAGGQPDLRVGVVLADAAGQVLAGRLFSPTIVFEAEAVFDELKGET